MEAGWMLGVVMLIVMVPLKRHSNVRFKRTLVMHFALASTPENASDSKVSREARLQKGIAKSHM
jgi:hypothetical protein